MDLRQLIKEYLQKPRVMQLATSANNIPWCCTLYFAYDEDFNFYWLSKPSQRHSKEILKNPSVAGAIAYDQNPPRREVRGLQFEATALLLSGIDEELASKIYIAQFNREKTLLEDIRSGKNPHKLYRITPSRFVIFDRVNFPDNEKQEYIL